MKQERRKPKLASIYDYDVRIERTYKLMEKDISPNNVELIRKYDCSMIGESLAKATRLKHLQVILNLSRFLGKDWKDVTRDDVDDVIVHIVQEYCGESGQETNTSYDHKKILKIFFRWFKLGSRSREEVGDPDETKGVKIKKVKDKIVREDLVTDEDRTVLPWHGHSLFLSSCGQYFHRHHKCKQIIRLPFNKFSNNHHFWIGKFIHKS